MLLLAACAPDDADPGEWKTDADADGVVAAVDCDDADPARYPGALEHCDGLDEDCDGVADEDAVDATTWYVDVDGDAFGSVGSRACSQPSGSAAQDGDCDDTDARVHPSAAESCDGRDEDCDGEVDEDAADALEVYADADGDGYGTGDASLACSGTTTAGDCDDGDRGVHPGATESCDEVDEDCDGEVDEGAGDRWIDADGDGYGGELSGGCEGVDNQDDCDDGDPDIRPGAPEICDGLDDDCDGEIDEDAVDRVESWTDGDGDGWGSELLLACTASASVPGDCDDADADVHPGADEHCDGADEDCDGEVDEDAGSAWYLDLDGDGWGGEAYLACEGELATGGDCDDADAAVHPEAADDCDAVDSDCDGEVDEDAALLTWYPDGDGDGHGAGEAGEACALPEGGSLLADDCDDADAAVHPEADEACDGIDDDCDGLVDDEDEVVGGTAWFADDDGDGWGGALLATACVPPEGATGDYGDCDDADAEVSPDAAESCDAVDDDCDGRVDEGCEAIDRLDFADGLSWTGDAAGDAFGEALAALDFDGDGREELAVLGSAGGVYDLGAVWFFHHPLATGVASDVSRLRVDSDRGAAALFAVGDLDGDGAEDLAIGTGDELLLLPGNADAGTDTVKSSATAWTGTRAAALGAGWMRGDPATGLVETDDALFTGDAAEQAGESLCGADLDGDGVDEALVGAPGADRVYRVEAPFVDQHLADAELLEGDAGSAFGSALAAGDLDLDGVEELLVGAVFDAAVALDAGAIEVWVGLEPAASFSGGTAEDHLGGDPPTLADLDGDGAPEAAACAAGADGGGSEAGACWVFAGPWSGNQLLDEVALLRVDGGAGDQLRRAVFADDLEAEGVSALALGSGAAGVGLWSDG